MSVLMAYTAILQPCSGITILGAYCAPIGSLVRKSTFQIPQDKPKVELVYLVTFELHFVKDN